MKYYYTFIFFGICFIPNILFAQSDELGIRVGQVKPTESMGGYYNNTIGVDIYYGIVTSFSDYFKTRKERDNYKLKFGFTIGYHKFTPKIDTIQTIEKSNQYNYDTGLYEDMYSNPKQELKLNQSVIPLTFGIEYKILDFSLSPIVGLDIGAHFIKQYDSYYDSYSNGFTISEINSVSLASMLSAGISFNITDNICSSIAVGKNVYLLDVAPYWKTFVKLSYKFPLNY